MKTKQKAKGITFPPTKKEAEVLIKWAEKEIKEYEDFIQDLKLFASKKKINIKINI